MHRFGVWFGITCLVLSIVGCGGGGSSQSSGTAQVAVANVVGQTQAAATSAITGAGLTLGTVTTQSSSTVAAGSVISQSPVAGANVATGSAVNLVVSTGPPLVVPNVVGQTQAAATSAITGAGLILGTVTTQSSSTVAAGSVISQSPVAGASVATGSAVNLVVSTGPPQVAVPNVVGQTQAAATSAITGAGLILGTVTTQSSSTVAAGSVISQSPVAGANVATGSAVNLVVSTGPPQVAVPNVVGQTQAAATSAITGAGLILGTVTTQSSSTVAAGSVISQSPVAGASVATGSAVNLVVSTGPVTYPVSVSVTGLASGQSITVLDNGTDSLTFQTNSTGQFATRLVLNETFSVTVSAQPTLEACTVSGGNGQITGAVTVSVSCLLTPPSTAYPAFTAPYPLILSGQTPAVVISSPRFIPVFFTDLPDQSATLSYLQALSTSKEWSVLSEYGVGPATVGSPVYLTSAAPTTTTIAGIGAYVSANAASWGTLDGSEIFILYYPTSTAITDDTDTDSYHSWAATSTSQKVTYAVLPNYALANHAYVQYHELAEASTDPIPGEGYLNLNHDAIAWSFDESELADMCVQFSQFNDPTLSQEMLGIWSDAAVTQGQFPCTTAGSTNLGYGFGAYPVLPDTYLGSASPNNANASVGIAAGNSVTIPINIFSYGPLPAPVQLSASQLNTNSAKTNALTFSFDQKSGLNGSVVHLTITAPQTPLSTTTNYASFLVTATIPPTNGNQPQSVFPGLVTNPGASCSSQSLASSGGAEIELYGFTGGNDGSSPRGGLVLGSDGNFYGTTGGNYYTSVNIGSNINGNIFKITPGGTLTNLYSFSGTDGEAPQAALVQGIDGDFYGATYYGGANNRGSIFKVTTGGALTTLHSFSNTDGVGFNPKAALVQGSDGNFYGTAVSGGTNYGTVFKITPSGSLTLLYAFSGSDGSEPIGGLVQGTDGNFYGTTSQGGGSNDGTVFKMTPSGTLTVLHSFGGADGSDPNATMTLGSDGNFYGTTYSGGGSNDGTVFKITPGGSLTTLYSFSGADGSNPSAGLLLSSDGNFYGTTYFGGTYSRGTVFKITSSGALTTLYSFADNPDGAYLFGSLVQGTDGDLYGTTFLGGGCGAGSVFKIAP